MSDSDAGSSRISDQAREFITKFISPLASGDTASKGAANGSVGIKVLPIWADAKSAIDEQISALQSFLKSSGAPLFERIADSGLHGVTSGQFVSLQSSLMDFDSAAPNQKSVHLPKLTGAIKEMEAFVKDDDAVKLMDANPFKVDCAIRATTLAALSQISSAAQRIGATTGG